ncbi:MAG: aspartate aminotransferase family protein [Anaerolineales bacterium]|nr:aspartate aminotransferase family protein [Anaerolineales bacterium]
MNENQIRFPTQGKPKQDILAAMEAARQHDVNWRQGKVFSLVYSADQEVSDLLKEAYLMFFSENGLNPTAFPSLRKFETEVVAMAAALLGGDSQVVGNMTSGGTESLLMVVKTAREWARRHKPEASQPQMVLPDTAHPAFDKAAHYFGVQAVRVPTRENFRADVEACRAAITPQTILIVGSAPSFPHGVVDPIAELAQVAREHGLLFHVDACVGGFMLPFVRRLGYPVPDFDFQVEGVTSVSADLHKYGYAAKPASLVLYRTPELRRCQFFVTTDWSGGVYASPAMTGSRPGGSIAAAWAIIHFLGEEGYLRIAETVMQTTTKIRQGIASIPGIEVLGDPEMSIMAIGSRKLNVYEIGDEMTLRGWHLDRQQFPPSLHLTITYAHAPVADQFLHDLAESVAAVRKPSLHKTRDAMMLRLANAAVRILPEKTVSNLMERASSMLGVKGSTLPGRSAAIYGMIGTLPNRGDLHELVLELIDSMTRYGE